MAPPMHAMTLASDSATRSPRDALATPSADGSSGKVLSCIWRLSLTPFLHKLPVLPSRRDDTGSVRAESGPLRRPSGGRPLREGVVPWC